jgi:single-stranded-DNA-specific exonuclease
LAASYRAGGEEISLYTFAKGLRIFQELGLLHQALEEAGYYLPPIAGKMDLEASPTYRRHR